MKIIRSSKNGKRATQPSAGAIMLNVIQRHAEDRLHPLEQSVLRHVERSFLAPGSPEYDWVAVIHTRLTETKGKARWPFIPESFHHLECD